ncbi:DNA helicase [Clostridia bacterium]|nr:DNA helicase [Clostridia bacterium]
MELNEAQQKAVAHMDGPAIVLAGPGSGKTTVIANRVRAIIDAGVNPSQIAVITYTKNAAKEMESRFVSIAGNGLGVSFSTFHALYFKILRASYKIGVDSLLNEYERANLIRAAIAEAKTGTRDNDSLFKGVSNEISLVKNLLCDIMFYKSGILAAETFRYVYSRYEEMKSDIGKIDFDDMLTNCHTLLTEEPETLEKWRERFRYFLVDEFQDINAAQYETLKLLAAPLNNVFAVGDDDQSVYGFRGANPAIVREFLEDYKGAAVFNVTVNYRCSQSISNLAERIISRGKHRMPKILTAENKAGQQPALLIFKNARAEAEAVARKIKNSRIDFSSTAVLYRANSQAAVFVEALFKQGIPFTVKDGGGLFDHFVCRDICDWFDLAQNLNDHKALMSVYKKPLSGLSKSDVEAACENCGKLDPLSFIADTYPQNKAKNAETLLINIKKLRKLTAPEAVSYVRKIAGYDDYLASREKTHGIADGEYISIADEILEMAKDFKTPFEFAAYLRDSAQKLAKEQRKSSDSSVGAVTLSTMHGAKGLEFDTVFVVSAVDGLIPYELCDVEEERRLFYVAVTRAAKTLYISAVKERFGERARITPFLDGIKTISKEF